jgi:hypothetical protein
MFVSLNLLGSLVVDVVTNRMDVRFLDNTAVARDTFSIVKPATVSNGPAAPSALAALAVSPTQINLGWTDNSSNEDGFEVERALNGGSFALIATLGPNVTSFSDTGLRPNKRYFYRVRAFNADGSSAYSNTDDAKTPR